MSAPEKYPAWQLKRTGEIIFTQGTRREPPSRGGGGSAWDSLVTHVQLARDQLYGIPIASVNVPEIRGDVVDTLVAAIKDAQTLAKESSAEAAKGMGGVPPKARWYQLVGYLAQVLDGVCKNVELSEINERLMRVEKTMKIAQTKPASPR